MSSISFFYIDDVTVKVRENSWLAKIAAYKMKANGLAMVIGKTIHLHGVTTESFISDERWLKHEMCHVKQFQRYGFWRFIFLYLKESLKHGYTNNRFEQEARKMETEKRKIEFNRT
jgi:hypothetical protein